MEKLLGGPRKQTTIALLLVEADYVIVALAAKGGIWIKAILKELKIFEVLILELNCNNQSCINLAQNPNMRDNIRHVSYKHLFLRGLIEDTMVELKFVPSASIWADFLTNPITSQTHISCCKKIKFLNSLKIEEKYMMF